MSNGILLGLLLFLLLGSLFLFGLTSEPTTEILPVPDPTPRQIFMAYPTVHVSFPTTGDQANCMCSCIVGGSEDALRSDLDTLGTAGDASNGGGP